MILPTYLSLSAAAQLAGEASDSPCSPDWILQFIREGRLQLFFRPMRWYVAGNVAEVDSLKYYESGKEYPLDCDWAGKLLPTDDGRRAISVATLPDAFGKASFVLDATSEKRTQMILEEGDLFVLSADVERLAVENDALDDAEFTSAFAETVFNGVLIDWEYWVHKMPVITAAQAARLMCALDPDKFADLSARPNRNDPSQQCTKAMNMQRLAEAEGIDKQSPLEWMAWANAHGLKIHPQFEIETRRRAGRTTEAKGATRGNPEANNVPSSSLHRLTNRVHPLEAVTVLAMRKAVDDSNCQSVWDAFVEMALGSDRPAPLLGYVEGEGVKYRSDQGEYGVSIDSKKAFFARFKRRTESRQATLSHAK